jgi:hypothetical protein
MAKKYVRPPGWYRTTVENLVKEKLPPLLGPLSPETAWKYVYSVVMWTETVDGNKYLHLQERDKLDKKSGREFADRAADYLRSNLGAEKPCDPFQLVNQLGLADIEEKVGKGFPPPKKRDPNVTGAAFETVIQVLIGELCGVTASRTPDLNTLQGFELAPVGYHSRPDLALFGPRDFRLLISTKWTLRKERIGTYLHEAFFYKQRRPDLQVAYVLSEFNMNILSWLSQDPLADRVYHVNKDMLLNLYDPFAGIPPGDPVPRSLLGSENYRRWLNISEKVFDLSQLFRDITQLVSVPDEALDPEDEETAEVED